MRMGLESLRRFDEEPFEDDERVDEVCPERDGRLVSDDERGESVCKASGLVVEEDEVDRSRSGARLTARNVTRTLALARRPT